MIWRRELIDLGLMLALYVLVELARTEGASIDSWQAWARGVAIAAGYKALPPLVQILGTLRAKYGAAG